MEEISGEFSPLVPSPKKFPYIFMLSDACLMKSILNAVPKTCVNSTCTPFKQLNNSFFFRLVLAYPEVGIVINFNKNENVSNCYLVTSVSMVSLNFRVSLSSVSSIFN